MGDSKFFNCPNCGRIVVDGGVFVTNPYRSRSKGKVIGRAAVTLLSAGDIHLSTDKFCCRRCGDEFWKRWTIENAERVSKKEEKKNEKVNEKKEKLENSKETSTESLAKVSKACLVAGYLGAHRFAVGKFGSGLLMPILLVLGIVGAIMGRNPSMLGMAGVDIVWWLYDLAVIKSKKFTDKYGHTIRE